MTLEPPAPPRSPWQLFYGAVHAARRRWYRERARHLPRPVLSIGNLHFGGTGKTPLTIAVAGHLRDRGLRVAILSRGYRRARGSGADVRIVSAGEGPLLGPRSAGDEPVLMAGELPGVAVLVGTDRASAGLYAMSRLPQPPDIFVLDDGFSHLALARDLDLLLFPLSDPFAKGRLPPSGRLREPLAAASRADAVVLTGAEAGHGTGVELAQALFSRGFAGPGFSSRTVAGQPRDARGEVLRPGARVVLAAGIARPENFFATARALGFEVVATLAFPDHHEFTPASIVLLERAARDSNAEAILLTAKDLVKLRGRSEWRLAELPVRAEPEAAFWTWLDSRLRELVR